MSDEGDKPEDDDEAKGAQRAQAGERLAEARRDAQISVDEVAKELHLDEFKVRALERNDFDVLGAPVFAKGHLRKYAQLVAVDPDEVLADYYELNRSASMPPVVGKVRKPEREINLGRWVTLLIVLVVIGALYWWFFERDVPQRADAEAPGGRISLPDQREEDQDPQLTPDGVEATLPPGDATGQESDNAGDEALAESAPEEVAIEPQPAPVVTPAVPDSDSEGLVRVGLSFSGDCWTEITDADGDRLFFALGQDGRTANIAGEPPLSVLIGNAENVRLTVNGAAYVIPAADRRGRTARFSIGAP